MIMIRLSIEDDEQFRYHTIHCPFLPTLMLVGNGEEIHPACKQTAAAAVSTRFSSRDLV